MSKVPLDKESSERNLDRLEVTAQIRNGLDWAAIKDAVVSVANGKAKRIDGEGWKVYVAGTIVRIDITVNKEQ